MIIQQQPSILSDRPQVSSMVKSRRRSVSPAEPPYRLAQVLVEQEKWQEAIAAYQQALTITPNWVEVQRELGDLFLKLECWDQAVEVYEIAIGLRSDGAAVYHNLGEALLKLQRWEDAVAAYQKAIELNPEFSWSYNNLGDGLREVQRWDQAAQAYQKAIELKPDFALSHHNLGDILVKKEDWENAIAAYQKAVDLDPNFVWSHYNLGDVLAKKEEWESAISAYRAVIKLDPNLSQVHEKLGDALRHQIHSSSEEISQVYHRAVADNPTDLEVYYKALEVNPKDAEMCLKLADILKNQGKLEQAVTFYKSTLQIEPNNAEIQAVAWQKLGDILRHLGHFEEAAKSYHQLVELKPEWAESHFNLIQVLVKLGRLQEAEKAGDKAVEIEPRLANFYRNLGVIKGDILAVDTAYQIGERPKVAVCSWELAHNPAGRAYTLAQLYQAIADVEMIGSIFPQYGRELWEPICKTSIPCHSFIVEDESQFVEQAMNLVLSHPYDVVHLSKPRMPNILFGLLYKLVWDAQVIVDIDDEELAFVQAETAIELEDFLKSQGQLPELKNLTGKEWTQIAVGLVKEFDAVTVSNPALKQLYGGQIIRHARDEKHFQPSSERRSQSRERLGISEDKKVVLFLGTPREHKGLVATAKALANLGRQDVVFVIVGDFPDPSLKAKLQAIQGVEYLFLGNQPFDEIPDVVAVGDVCVLLQDGESPVSQFQIPAKLSDALGMGLTVLLSESGAAKDIVDSGAVIRVTEQDLGAALSRVLSDGAEAHRFGSNARELFTREFTLAKNGQRLAFVLGSIMARSTGKGRLSDGLNLLLGGLPSVSSVLSGWGEQKVESQTLRKVGQGVSVIVLSLNGAALLDRLLSTFFATNTYFPVELIIIDHGSEDNTAEVVVNQGVKGDIRYVNRGGNFSFSDSCNYGASLAKYPYLLFLNNDIVFTSDVLPLAVSRLDDATIGAVGVRLDDEPSSLPKGKKPGVQHTGIEFVWNEQRGYFQPEQIRHGSLKDYLAVSATGGDFFPAVTGAFLLCRKGDFEKVGGFSLDYDYGLEDIDFCLRLGRDLQKICYCINRVSLQHREGATRQKGNQQQRREVRENNHRLFKASWQEFLSSYKLPTSCERELIAQSSLFDESWYIMKYAQFIGQDVDPINHYLTKGASKGFNPSPLFDAEYYFSQVSSADKTTENPLIHYLTDGWKKYDPNPYFSTSFYLQFYSNELKTLTPLEHYATQMPPHLFYPSPIFSNSSYLNHNPDVASSGLNPLWHYLSSGKQEDRSIQEYYDDIIPYRIESTCEINSDDDVLIYVAFCPKGKLSDLQVDTINSFVNQGYKVIVVVNSGHYSLCVHPGITKASACITRENFGYDFGAWRLACRIFISLNKAHSITFTNDSIVLLDDFKHSESLRLHINKSGTDVVYLTRNTARKNHFQSYFFTIKATAIQKGALYLMRNNDYYLRKDKIILMLELDLWDKFSDLGLKISEVFAHHKSADERKNPTIHYWKELCDQGFPFLKLQLFTSGLYQLEDPEFMAVLKPSQIELIKKHLSERNQAITYYHDRNLELNYPPQSALPTPARFGEIGQLQAYNPPSSHIPSLEVPLCGIDNIKLSELSKVPILAVIHCFYVDIAAQILERISTVSSILQLQVVCTTDTSEKLTELNRLLGKYQLDGFVVITQNRGRDVAPFLIEGAKYIKDAKFILHLHTKKSPHHSKLSNWGDFLFDNLIGSKDIILSNLLLLSQRTVGLVYSEHFAEVKNLRNWGFDFNHAKKILQRLGVNLSSEMLLEFPSSTMFWARIEAIQPLFDLNLDYRDFEEESGQIDGTLAHAIERSILYVVEHQGFYGIKVLEKFSQQKDACWKLRADELDYGLSRLRPVKLLGSSGSPSPNANTETYPINITVSPCQRPRFNLLIPTMQPQRIYGGVSTAIKVGKELFSQLDKSVDFRLIVTSDKLDEESILESCYRLDLQFFSSRPNEDISSPTIVPLYHYRHVPLSIRSSDVFFATAWWTADLGFRLRRQQFEAFGSPQMPLIYLIQDYEPGFYTWSRRSAIARATYEEENIIALINSEELANFLTKEYSFRAAYHYPYILNETLASKLHPTQKELIILIYGRPSVERNLFPIILEGLQMWQADNPAKNTMFKLIFAGEDFDEKLIAYLENASVVGKLSLEDYSDTLNKTAIGISLMESPHPSYPPLEMASAGCITITNGYYNKNLALRSPNILSIKSPTPLNLKCALDKATKMIDLKEITPLGNIGKIPTTVPVVNYLEIAKILKEVW